MEIIFLIPAIILSDGFTSNNAVGNDPSIKTDIIKLLKDKWIDKSKLEIIMDKKDIRNIKLENILK